MGNHGSCIHYLGLGVYFDEYSYCHGFLKTHLIKEIGHYICVLIGVGTGIFLT